MKSEEIDNATDEQYHKAMIEMVQSLLEVVSGHDALFGMQALMGAIANIIIDTAPDAESGANMIMGLAITTSKGVINAFEMMEDEDRLEGEEHATHETPFRTQ